MLASDPTLSGVGRSFPQKGMFALPEDLNSLQFLLEFDNICVDS